MQIIKLKFRQVPERGFLVTLSCSSRPWELEGYLSLMPMELKTALQEWQNNYRTLDGVRSYLNLTANFRVIPKSVRVSSSSKAIDEVKSKLNLWLNNTNSEWQTIRDGLISFANQLKDEEIQILLNTQNSDLCRLPWQEWDLLRQYYPQTEVAISTPTAKDLVITNSLDTITKKKARILLVVGKSDGINTESDLKVVKNLLGKKAEIIYLLQPSLKELVAVLWCEIGYDIFIFTGHSGSNDDGTIGWIELNNDERLTIEEFKESFKQAIDRGLQLAIFNSCDGLGLADRLSELNLTQIIVMSEPVPDEIAIEFLSHFFQELINYNSLFAAVHKARKKLEHFNSRYPGAIWLPTLCLKPAQRYFSWQAIEQPHIFLKENNIESNNFSWFDGFIKLFLVITISLITFIIGISSNLIFPQLDTNFITKPIEKITSNYIDREPQFDFPLGTWQYSGSTTWQPISRAIAERLQIKYPHSKLIYTYHPRLPNGSGTGIKMLLDGQISFALSSRPVEDNEYDLAIRRGKILKQVPVAIDGVAVVVNSKLNIDGLTVKQLEAIYRGKITNWAQINGQDLPIIPYTRPLQSGTTEFFRNNILKDRTYGKNIVFIEDSNDAIERITDSDNLGGIYFVSASEVINNCHLKILSIARRPASKFFSLTKSKPDCNLNRTILNEAGLQTGEYPLVRRLFVIIEINSPIDEEVGEAYKNYLLSKSGQETIAKSGFIPIRYF